MKKAREILGLITWTAILIAFVFLSLKEYAQAVQAEKYDPSKNWVYLDDPLPE